MESLSHYFFLIFFGAMVLGTIGLYLRQPLLVVYVVLGAILGPFGFDQVKNLEPLLELSEIGIIFLLFLLGLDLKPQSLMHFFREVATVSILSCMSFFVVGYVLALTFGLSQFESIIVGISVLFSSTILGIKLLPTTVLHHQKTGKMIIGVLLVQDFFAIFALVLINALASGSLSILDIVKIIAIPPLLYFGCRYSVKWFINPIISRFDQITEFIFMFAIGWCIGIAHLAEFIGLSLETGAFIAGVSLANSAIAQYIAIHLKPLRDFFLVIFFFALGALFNFEVAQQIYIQAIILAVAIVVVKPVVLHFLSNGRLGNKKSSWDLGLRLGQLSEFSLLIALLALEKNIISIETSTLIQAAALLTILISSYVIVMTLPNPIAPFDRLRRD